MRACIGFVGVVSAVFAVAAMGQDDRNAGPCPQAFALYDAVRVVNFPGGTENYSSVGFTAEIQSVKSLCSYQGRRPIVANLEIDFGFGRGPAAEGREFTYTYWVAVTRTDRAVIAKETFPITVKFDRDEERTFRREKIEQITIPRASETVSGTNFEIVVGFEVTPEQLEFNRAGKRFKIDAGEG